MEGKEVEKDVGRKEGRDDGREGGREGCREERRKGSKDFFQKVIMAALSSVLTRMTGTVLISPEVRI